MKENLLNKLLSEGEGAPTERVGEDVNLSKPRVKGLGRHRVRATGQRRSNACLMGVSGDSDGGTEQGRKSFP